MSNLIKGAALFIGGAIAGATAALLLSPKTGEEMREELKDLATEASKRAQGYCEKVKEEVEKLAKAHSEEAKEA